ncbi:MAG TPA: YkvA family protein [Thermomicrobiales bacterium]|nr:YkvA family protein [Thermomicrobiales bacterium]
MAADVESLNLLQRAQLVWSLMRDDRVSGWVKKAAPAAIIAYVISPIDVIPDFLLGAGQVDDVGVVAVGLVLLARLLVRFAPRDVVEQHVSRITGTWDGQRSRTGRPDGPTIDTRGRVRQQ